MVRLSPERVLIVADADREVQSAVESAAPAAQVVSVANVFDAVAELAGANFSAVFVAAEPIERRPDAAVRALRDSLGSGRLFLFGHPTLEILSRKMLEHGCDDYIILPPDPSTMKQLLAAPLRLSGLASAVEPNITTPSHPSHASHPSHLHSDPAIAALLTLPLADMVLAAQLQHPNDAPAALIEDINAKVPGSVTLHLVRAADAPPAADADRQLLSQSLPATNGAEAMSIHLLCPRSSDPALVQQALHPIAALFGKLADLQDRHNRLQRLAVTDELTGLYNGRYFRHFLAGIIERARQMQFTVSLLLFDIDDFKHYNDKYGHGIGDEILRQTATLMRRCCRDHDLVARIGGDEFAVVFWEKEGPRQPRPPSSSSVLGPPPPPGHPVRRPQTPLEIFKRFKRLIETEDFSGLGSSGRGKLGISAGMASFPWNAPDAAALIKAADDALMFGAKQTCKNTIYLVGGADESPSE
jgi:GGDEF domain-containing protein